MLCYMEFIDGILQNEKQSTAQSPLGFYDGFSDLKNKI